MPRARHRGPRARPVPPPGVTSRCPPHRRARPRRPTPPAPRPTRRRAPPARHCDRRAEAAWAGRRARCARRREAGRPAGRRRLRRLVGPQRRGELARVPARRHPQFAPQTFAEAHIRRQRGAAIAGSDERRHQAADGALAQRIQPRSPARPFDRHRRIGRVADACRERGAEPVAALVTRRERPLVLEPAQQLAALGQLGRRRDITPVQGRIQFARVHLRTVGECQPVAADEDRVARRAEVTSQRPQRVAQALARALVQDVGPEAASSSPRGCGPGFTARYANNARAAAARGGARVVPSNSSASPPSSRTRNMASASV